MSGAYVFVGPTLPISVALAELDATYLPPATAGAVYELWRHRPRAVGIIDGYFEHRPAVWHKEILWMMEHGVHVFGSAGHGALRAVELETFGMRGVGHVYQAFRDGTLDQDDEVAVSAGSAADGCGARSEAMVNIRATLLAAQRQEIISSATRDLLTEVAKARFYAERHWPDLLEAGLRQAADLAEISTLRQWLPTGRVDQMASDAIDMLREMRRFLGEDPDPQQVPWRTSNTAIWSAVRQRAGSGAKGPPGSAPELWAVMDEIRLLGPDRFQDARRRALLRLFATETAERAGMQVDKALLREAIAEFRATRDLEGDAEFAAFLAANDMSASELERLVAAEEAVRQACADNENEAWPGFLDDLRIRGQYAEITGRAADKADRLDRSASAQRGAPGRSGSAGPDILSWYFAERIGTEVPADLAGYARAAGFRDELAFRRAIGREYRYMEAADDDPR